MTARLSSPAESDHPVTLFRANGGQLRLSEALALGMNRYQFNKLREAAVIQTARDQRLSLKNPPRTTSEFLDTLAAQGLPVSADRLREFEELI